LIKAVGEIIQCIAGQAENQVGMQMRAGMFTQPANIIAGLVVVLFATNPCLNFGIKNLNTDLKLQTLRRELLKYRFELFR
jgi:hypothetical protein